MKKSAGAFQRLSDNLAELAQIPSRITKPIADALTTQLSVQFQQGSDPYGNPWVKLAPSTIRKKGHDLIMIDTGRMQRETVAVAMPGAGVMILTVPYAAYHQVKVGSRPARPVLPNRRDLPVVWQTIIETEWAKAFQKTFG